ncbi:putative LPS assembly protein LptD [Dysgonomonas sp. 511]|uniref:putative LPS assembly protein LptD n=1 Tax=Dysgonomonas sp. 511 TaxID=2302930 RepID=UPI0013D3B1AB|nr:putative LPS assembly protein LptD [Dysgonomonas sp. 511]NDV77934.1 LPS-assembly protein LptD [Dysgonomonas sp. 511]
MRKIRILTYLFLCILFSIPFIGAQYTRIISLAYSHYNDSLPPVPAEITPDSLVLPPDSLLLQTDSLAIALDSVPTDSVPKKKDMLDAIVDYKANDSIVLTAGNMGYLYGNAEVTYTNIKLTGERISVNMDSSLVHATYGLDSVGKEFGYPIFSDRGTDYESKSMRYNFKTQKGHIIDVRSAQGEGYVIGKEAKKNEDNSFFMLGGKYTTCDDHEHPHFYLALTKAKVKPKKNVVTGPAYLVIEGLPLPIGLPFGFFPFSDKYSSGVIMPSYGDDMDRGFNLRDGGYYFAINDNIDLALTGEIFTKGSWGLNARSTYRKRYKYSGSFDGGYLVTKTGEKGVDYAVAKDLRINWTHTQDPKANQFRTLSASVNFSTSSYERNNLGMSYTPQGTQNIKSSSVNFTQRIPNSPWSLSGSVNVSQRSQDSSISLTLPNLTFTMSRIAPFKRKDAAGDERWYEKIQLSYSGEFRNSINTKEDLLLKSNFQKDWNNGMRHSVPISATFSAFNYLNITPSINYNERWYTSKIRKEWDPERNAMVAVDTAYSFNRVYDFSTALSFQTKMYGFFVPVFSKSTTIRHVFTPSITLSYAPDFSSPRWGFYETEHYLDQYGQPRTVKYSPYEQGMFGTAPGSAQGLISFDFDNNLEMKVASESDSTGYKKISLIDNLRFGFSHNMMADSIKWSNINASMRLKFSKSFTINLNAVFDTYMYEADERNPNRGIRVDKLRISHGKGFGRLMSTGYSISPSINQDTFKKLFGKGEDKDKSDKDGETSDGDASSGEGEGTGRRSAFEDKKDDNTYDEDGYVKNQIMWNLGLNFSMNLGYGDFDAVKKEYKYRLTKTFGFNGSIQPTKNWSFNFNSSYDFDAKKIAYMSCNLTRNLHCWSISASFNPVGQYKSYYVTLRASSSMLQDLKQEWRGRTTSYDPNWD